MTKEEIKNDIGLLRAQLKYIRKAEENSLIYENKEWLKEFGNELSRRIKMLLVDLSLIIYKE